VPEKPLSSALAGAPVRTSPDYVRISMASAIALRMRSGRFSRDFHFGGINILLNYPEGCRSNCGYCGLARERPGSYEDKSFIRVEWPLVATDDVIERMAQLAPGLDRVCISMVTHGHAYSDTCEIAGRIAQRISTPLSVLIAPPMLDQRRLENLKSIGVDMIGVGLDAVSKDLFVRTRTGTHAGGLSWENYWEVIDSAREIFGAWKLSVHLLVGLGETDHDLFKVLVALSKRQISAYLFCFNPEPDSALAGQPRCSLERWRRVQLARYLIVEEGYGLERFSFHRDGRLAGIGASLCALDQVVGNGAPFVANGCPAASGGLGCTRPYGSYRPAEPFRDYPFVPSPSDIDEIREELGLAGVVEQVPREVV